MASERHIEACRQHLRTDALAHFVVVAEIQRRTCRQGRVQPETKRTAVARQPDTSQRLPLLQANEAGVEYVTMRSQGALPLRMCVEAHGTAVAKVPTTVRAHTEA